MTQRVILAGGGHAHLAVLADWAKTPLPGTERALVTSSRYTVYSGMVPGWLAGIYTPNQLTIDLAPLAEAAGAKLVIADVVGLDPEARQLQLSTGDRCGFDIFSLAIGGDIDTARLGALGDRLLPIRPMDAFIQRWSQLLDMQPRAVPFAVAVVGGGAGGVELALGIDRALCRAGQTYSVSLVTPAEGLLAGHVDKVRKLALGELERRRIAVHFAEADGTEAGLVLTDGQMIAADCVIAATGSRAPSWLAQTGLACTALGFISVGADMRSVSHPAIFAAGDIIARADRNLARSGVHAVKAGPVLAANLRAAVSGGEMGQYQPSDRTLYLLALGDKRAIASWGGFATSGRLAWLLKDQIDRRFVQRYS